MTFDAKTADRFWAKVVKTEGCWLWQGAQSYNGYGIFYVNGRTKVASRAIYQSVNNCLIPENFDCGHKCDTRLCVNPDHLVIQSRSENMIQAARQGHCSRYSEQNSLAKLKTEQVVAIRSRLSKGERAKDIASDFGVHRRTVQDIGRRHTWRHVK